VPDASCAEAVEAKESAEALAAAKRRATFLFWAMSKQVLKVAVPIPYRFSALLIIVLQKYVLVKFRAYKKEAKDASFDP
jgi:hypothetical protein